MDEIEAAWVAGLIEGEGCIGQYTYPRSGGFYTKTILQVEMKDLDVLERLQTYTGHGTIRFKQARGNSAETWVWTVTRKTHIREIAEAILPHMGNRRSKKIKSILW